MNKFNFLQQLNRKILELDRLLKFYKDAPETSMLIVATIPKEVGAIGNMMIDNLQPALGYAGNPTSTADAIARKMRSDPKFAAYMITVIDLIKLSGKMPNQMTVAMKKLDESGTPGPAEDNGPGTPG